MKKAKQYILTFLGEIIFLRLINKSANYLLNLLLTKWNRNGNISIVENGWRQDGEVVELVYGTSLENWRGFVAHRGFESHPLRQRPSTIFI